MEMALRKGRWIGLVSLVLGIAAWITVAPAAEAAGCPNEPLRGGLSGLLPECRAYEMVSPPEKANTDVENRGNFAFRGIAGFDGDYSFASLNGLPGSENGGLGTGNVALRGAAGWATTPVGAPELNQTSLMTAPPLLLSRDLNQVVVPSKVPGVLPSAQEGESLYLRTISPPSLRLMTPIPQNRPGESVVSYETRNLIGASYDFSRIFFYSEGALTPDSPELALLHLKNLYEYDGSKLTNIGILPGETEPNSRGVSPVGTPWRQQVSADGSRIVFVYENQPYLRDHGTPVKLSEPAPGVESPGSGVSAYLGGSTDLSHLFFYSAMNLTPDAFTGESSSGVKNLAPNLYRYDVDAGRLTDLTIDRTGELGANVKNAIIAPDGEAAFFVALGVMAPGATLGAPNLYRWSATDGIDFIAELAAGDSFPNLLWEPEQATDKAGDAVAFVSAAAPTGQSPVGVKEIYHWSTSEGLDCVSCMPAAFAGGASPSGALMPRPNFVGGAGFNPMTADGGKVFFSTADRLVTRDTNGKLDAYEWVNGEVRLISPGSGDYSSEFLDAAPSGKDVYIVTRDRLVAADRDENTDVYDAREGGGFADSTLSVACEAEACLPPVEAAPPTAQVGSRSLDASPSPKPAAQKPKQQQKKKHHKKKHHKKANQCKAHAKQCQRKSHGRTTGKRG